MDRRSTRAREIQEAIRVVLIESWDPCRVKDHPELADEYDAYIGGIYALLARGRPPTEIARHLATVEQEVMGFSTDPSALTQAAERLARIGVALDPDEAT